MEPIWPLATFNLPGFIAGRLYVTFENPDVQDQVVSTERILWLRIKRGKFAKPVLYIAGRITNLII
jgi:hypothetical protein